ncbi:MAG TPA: hypothetical protein VF070_02605 [Streptosporangiaceae bacterium]
MTLAVDRWDQEPEPRLRAVDGEEVVDGTSHGRVRAARIDEPSRADYGERLRDLAEDAAGHGSDAGNGAADGEKKAGKYWAEVPRLEHEACELRQQCRQEGRDGQPEAPGVTHRSDVPPSPDIGDAFDQIRQSETAITADIRKVASDNSHGLWLEGLDCRLKGEARLREKLAELIKAEPDRVPSDMVREMPDAVRYTFCADTASYSEGFSDIRKRLEERGYEMYQCRNFWSNAEYKGINTRWTASDGQRFEVQFHTAESFHAKHHLTHWAYELLRLPRTAITRAERQELLGFQREVSSHLEVPPAALDISDYKKGDQ